MNYTVLIADDEQAALTRLKLHLEKNKELQSIVTCQNGVEALRIIKEAKPQIVFMDIEMPEMNGVEVLRNCEEPFPYFVFVTAYNSYAIEAFEQNAIDYVLKPYELNRIDVALEKAIQRVEQDRLVENAKSYKSLLLALTEEIKPETNREYIKRIAVKSIGRTSFIDVKDIVFIQAADQYVEVLTDQNKFVVRESMDQLESSLNPKYFFRTHRSIIVNGAQVVAIENVDKHSSLVVLKNQKKVKISNSKKANFKSWMNS